ncbi:MAG: zinc ribbon domain-containing protein [Peptoniphilus grossensis]|uniref:zinc ribbon domain-containing protein n=1 Tax=Peptoniphilus grossensis TaxID=1465756 RepID=UPI00290CD81D|nr:zinc ribbon domain-containing protein [Peptoniphilus grossensis]MDU7151513.1 zinc ribbon domain-containing protein [Peptoniphilus grossensis]
MFCPKCGNPVSKEDNFCASCGHNLKDVKVRITSKVDDKKEDTTKVKKVSEHTRVFNPKSLDAIDTTDELKNIIAEVDRKISKNIEDYQKGNVQSKSPAKEKIIKKSPAKDIDIEKKSKVSEKKLDPIDTKKADKEFLAANNDVKSEFGMSQKELVRRVQEELKKSNYKEKEKTSSAKEEKSSQDIISKDDSFENSYNLEDIKIDKDKKFSLKEKWKNFINEEDDEFSIFSSIKDDSKKKEDTRNLEISKSLEDSEKTFENTLSTPKIDIENAIKKSEEEKKKKAKEAEEEKKSKEIISDKKDHDKIKASGEEKISKDSKASEKVEPLEKEAATLLKEKKSKNLKALFSFKDKGEKPVKEINSVDSKVDKVIEEDLSNKVSDVETKISQKSMDGLDKVLDFLSKITNKISNYVGDFGSKESKIVIGIGALLNAIALLIGSGSFRFILILFLILKMVFDYFEFYVPLNIATDRDDIDTSYPEVKKFALINWIICKVFLFLGFLISPFGGFLKYNMLQALTAMPLATFLLVVLSVLIAITLYSREFIGRSKINFIGWYAIAFTLFELLFKMIWFIINFIFVTLF